MPVEHGLGIAVVPLRMIGQALQEGKVVPFSVEGMKLKRQFVIVRHKNKFLSRSAQAFVEIGKGKSSMQNSTG